MTTAIQNFIIEASLINPVNDIISKLEAKDFRDCDIKWLNDRLYKFTAFAAETLSVKFPQQEIVNEGVMNEYVTERFLNAFRTLLNYFKSF